MRAHHPEHIVHHGNRVGRRFVAKHAGQSVIEEATQFDDLIGRRRTGHQVDALAQRFDQVMVMRERAAHFLQFLALRGEALGEDFLIRQDAFAHAAAEGLFLDLRDALEGTGIFEPDVGEDRLQIRGGHHAVERRQFASGDVLLQHGTRHTQQLGSARKRQRQGHIDSPQ